MSVVPAACRIVYQPWAGGGDNRIETSDHHAMARSETNNTTPTIITGVELCAVHNVLTQA